MIENQNLALELIREYPLGLLISNSGGAVVANYLPFLFIEENQEAYLITHLAKANPQWKALDREVIVSFQGPNRYISPTIYKNKLNVPTWSYAAVQASGSVEVISDPVGLKCILKHSIDFFEKRNGTMWAYELPIQMQERMESAIIGLKIKLEKIEGKFKLNQNRDAEDYNSVLQFFEQSEQQSDQILHDWMIKTHR